MPEANEQNSPRFRQSSGSPPPARCRYHPARYSRGTTIRFRVALPPMPAGYPRTIRAVSARNDHPLPRGTAVIARLMPSRGITNAVYQKLTGGSRRTALRELDALVQFGILDPKGKGRGAYYALGKTKRAINAPITNGIQSGQREHGLHCSNPSNPAMTSILQTRHKPVNPSWHKGQTRQVANGTERGQTGHEPGSSICLYRHPSGRKCLRNASIASHHLYEHHHHQTLG